MKITFPSLLIIFSITVVTAQKKILDHPDFDVWNTIQNTTISNDGNYIMYALEKGETDNHLKIKTPKSDLIFEYQRGENGKFTYNSEIAVFTIKAWQNEVKELKRKKVKKNKLPKDTLGIYNLKTKSLIKIANIKSYKFPEKGSSHIAYLLEEVKADKKKKGESKDEKEESKEKKSKLKKVSKDNGYHLVVRNIYSAKEDTLKFVTSYHFSEDGKNLAFISTGKDKDAYSGVYVMNLETNALTEIYTTKKAKYYQLNFSETGKNLGFIVDADTTKIQVRPNELYHWKSGDTKAVKLSDANTTPNGYRVSSDGNLTFSKDESKLYFGLATAPIVKDTTLLDEEIVNVEVWTYNEPTLYTIQELQVENERKRSYLTAIHLNNNNKLVQIGTKQYPNVTLANEGNANNALINTSLPYDKEIQWEGALRRDYAIINTNSGKTTEALKGVRGQITMSPMGKYAYGYSEIDSSWITYNISSQKLTKLTNGKVFYNETNDLPSLPRSYGLAGWTNNDSDLIIYDRYDIWSFNPETATSNRLTKGRETNTIYRYVELNNEARSLNSKGQWLLRYFNENTKYSGYAELNMKTGKLKSLISGPYRYGRVQKAQQEKGIVFTRESFTEFPNIRYSDLNFKKQTILSDANPQQKDYNWGTSELVKWTSLDGKELTGMLIKPENFDPNKKYPMIVNFYDRSSDGVYNHRAPSPGRSTINYSFYTSRGYLIFNPDVYYRTGYPGESAYNCVISGVTNLIEKGFVDKDNIGVQGHSWGGYQIAYLVTKTDIFKAAEAGAPVPNMISAYGGIRWWTGLSRQFQYEHTQSRIGGTPWEYPTRYIENSPIFSIDKINTPLLIMHNDADGHVPWYQGIEFFMSLRRLQKPAWFLNYNDEPHWPLKLQNRKDFNIRMAQFFDHHLKGKPMPMWMKRGIPAIEKGINQGYELESLDKN